MMTRKNSSIKTKMMIRKSKKTKMTKLNTQTVRIAMNTGKTMLDSNKSKENSCGEVLNLICMGLNRNLKSRNAMKNFMRKARMKKTAQSI